ncbi:MAG: hypothetical protein V2I48_16465 [Xanthomonadales bacterium]|jgi:hypothetical protein|nr:hypothetical protein [Xanthomonadales bacterium]
MKMRLRFAVLAALFASGAALACEYKPGETKFLDYATCLYPKEEVVVVGLPEDASWDQCIYRVQAFIPAKLLAITRDKDGKEEASINCRGSIGNPCYLMKSACDTALRRQQASSD